MASKPSIPKGTRDFSPEEMVRRNYIFDTIRSVYKKYGYQPIETPAMENTETLMGKYGEEGDRLIFKIINSGDYAAIVPSDLFDIVKIKKLEPHKNSKGEVIGQIASTSDFKAQQKLTSLIAEKALRYDLTVPFARYVVQHQSEITFPFKRYQIQPVWRADKPQKGRYREFFQCDADVIGSTSLLNEIELVQMIDEVFTTLGVSVKIHFSNRKVLQGIAESIGYPDRVIDIAVAIDKLDKVGIVGVNNELVSKGFTGEAIEKLQPIINPETRTRENITAFLTGSEIGRKGLDEITFVGMKSKLMGIEENKLYFDISLARGLNYYTGTIFEVKVNHPGSTFTSSICGGGRYDDLTGVFGLKNMSGVGISFGADRICDVLDELNLYPESVTAGTRLLFINKGGKSEIISLGLLKKVREQNIAAEIYPDNLKWEKQAKYVDAKKIPFTATVEEDERISLRYQLNGKWNTEIVSFEELINKIK